MANFNCLCRLANHPKARVPTFQTAETPASLRSFMRVLQGSAAMTCVAMRTGTRERPQPMEKRSPEHATI
jgi:hypothetical protein